MKSILLLLFSMLKLISKQTNEKKVKYFIYKNCPFFSAAAKCEINEAIDSMNL